MFAQGRITFFSPDDPQQSLLMLKYEINQAGFQFYPIDDTTSRTTPRPLGELVSQFPALGSGAASVPYHASAVLSVLPASPSDAFYDVEFFYQLEPSASLSLVISHAEPFAHSAHKTTYFKDLALRLTQTAEATTVEVSGTVTAVVFDQEIVLVPQIVAAEGDGDRILIFTLPESSDPAASLSSVPIPPWGTLDITTLTVKPSHHNASGLQVFYTFDEQRGTRVYDCAGAGNPIDLVLTEERPGTITWQAGSISVNGSKALFASQNPTVAPAPVPAPAPGGRPGGGAPSAPSSAKRLIDACLETESISIAAWVKPSQAIQKGPGRIVTLSKNTGDRYFALAHGISDEANGASSQYKARFRTTETNANGEPSVITREGTAKTELSCVVYTRAKDQGSSGQGQGKNARFYLNGLPETDDTLRGGLSQRRGNRQEPLWNSADDSYKLALGNEVSVVKHPVSTPIQFEEQDDRPWLGQIYRVAIYNRVLSAEEVYRLYYPVLEAEGLLRLAQVPAPLDAPLKATLTLDHPETAAIQLTVEDTTERAATPQFHFHSIQLTWIKDFSPGGTPSWVLSPSGINTIQSTLWGNGIDFKVTASAGSGSGVFTLTAPLNKPSVNLDLEDERWDILKFSSLVLTSDPSTVNGPSWQVATRTSMTEAQLPLPRDRRSFDPLVDFKLLNPELAIGNVPGGGAGDRFLLKGTWLNQPIAFYGVREDGAFLLKGRSQFNLPFQLSLGPIFEPGTGSQLLGRVQISSQMQITLDLSLSERGFLANVSSQFTWRDSSGLTHLFTISTFPLLAPPLTPNQILDAVLKQLQAEAATIVATQFKHKEDYFFAVVENKPLLYLGASPNPAPSTGESIETYLPRVLNTASDPGPIQAGGFTLTQTAAGCTLTIDPQGKSQADLKADYLNFFETLEARALKLGAANLIKARIAERLPATVDQLLFYYYGVDPERNAVDLQAGMRLRVDYQTYQFVHPSEPKASSGFVGSGTTYYQLNSYPFPAISGQGMTLLGFDAFLNLLQPLVKTDVARVGAGGALDLLSTGYRMPYFRLLYPSQVAEVESQIGVERVATLVGATTLMELNTATADFQGDGTVAITDQRVSAYFRGRATVIPEIAIFVQGQPMFVPVGTTLRHVLERYASVPVPLPGQSLALLTGPPRIHRLIHDGVENTPSYRFVNLPSAPTTSSGLDSYDLPVVKGDRIFL